MLVDSSLSVIIPAYQAEKTIARAIKSVLTIDIDSLEVIVVNDGSTDSTSEMVRSIVSFDKRVNLIEQSNSGRSVARDVGFRAATGDWIMFVDADDFLLPDASSAVQQGMNSGSEIVLFPFVHNFSQIGTNRYFGGKRALRAVSALSFGDLREACLNFNFDCVPYSNEYQFNAVWSRLYRRDLLLEFSLKSPWNKLLFPAGIKFSEDRLFNIALLSVFPGGTVSLSDTPLYCWDLDASGTTGIFRETDVARLVDYSLAINQLITANFLSQSEGNRVLAAEISNQFKRFVRLNDVFASKFQDLWIDALAALETNPKLSDFPSAVLGPFQILIPSILLLLKGRIKCAYWLEKAVFNLQKLISSQF